MVPLEDAEITEAVAPLVSKPRAATPAVDADSIAPAVEEVHPDGMPAYKTAVTTTPTEFEVELWDGVKI